VRSRFNERIGVAMLEACRKRLAELRVAELTVVSVPGALEAPLALQKLANTERYDALMRSGGDPRRTRHFETVANESASGLMQVQLDSGVRSPTEFSLPTPRSRRRHARCKKPGLRRGCGGNGEPRQEHREEPQMKSARRRSRELALQACTRAARGR